MKFADRLHSIRLERGWSQGQLAAKAALQMTQVISYERGRSFPRSTSQDALAQAFGLTRDELMAGVVRHTRLDGRARKERR